MPPLGLLSLICSLVQIIGFLVLIATQASIPAVNALIGFAAIVTYFIMKDERVNPSKERIPGLTYLWSISGLCGFGLVLMALAASF